MVSMLLQSNEIFLVSYGTKMQLFEMKQRNRHLFRAYIFQREVLEI